MSIEYQILGQPVRDNALLVRINSGQRIDRVLFDCGYGCLDELTLSEILQIDHLCFSHLHMDHVAGFDAFFRAVFNRETKPNVLWGPPETSQIMQGRFRGYMWNLGRDSKVSWQVHDVHPQEVQSWLFHTSESFTPAHEDAAYAWETVLFQSANYSVETLVMDHMTPSLAYVVRESPKLNVATERLQTLGLRPGPWINELKATTSERETIEIDGKDYPTAQLREELILETPGESIAYLTDFRLDQDALAQLVPGLQGCSTVVCECQYRHEDVDLAVRNYHMTTRQVAELAAQANVGELVLFHLSERYTRDVWPLLLEEAREIFPRTRFSEHWEI
ncbi:MAG: MBL fold metallo-hydrolase [Gemmataceae bacterium]